jgi:3-methyladenine DNA glycosylase AlkD
MPDAEEIIAVLESEIAKADKPANRINYQQFFKEKLDQPIGLKTPVVRDISTRVFKQLKDQPKAEVLKLCDELLESGMRYGRFFAFEWAGKFKKDYLASDFRRFQGWLKNYVDNWGACDHLCGGPLGNLVLMYPELAFGVAKWRRSTNRWLRRASAVTLIVPVRNGILLDEVFNTADTLLTDDDDMVQKGYGWMLKEASNRFPTEVYRYVMKNKRNMPRTALRYAIEKLPESKKKRAMVKNW